MLLFSKSEIIPMDEAQLSAIEATDLFDDYNDINITDFLQQHQ